MTPQPAASSSSAPCTVSLSGHISAPPAQVYALLADYQEGHPRIVPKPYFTGIEVMEGGIGAGTVIRVGTQAMGQTRILTMAVTEPQPGRVLQEADVESDLVTRFTVNPVDDGKATRLTITTEWTPKPGLGGLAERWLAPGLMRKIFAEELKLIDGYFQDRVVAAKKVAA